MNASILKAVRNFPASKLIKTGMHWLGAHKSSCMIIGGVALMAIAVPDAVHETKDAMKELDDLIDNLDEEVSEVEVIKSKAVIIVKHALKPFILTFCGGVLVIFGHRSDLKSIAVMTAALQLSDSTISEYRKAAKEKIGVEKEHEIAEAASENVSEKRLGVASAYPGIRNAVQTGTGDILMFEPYTNCLFYSDPTLIKNQLNVLNYELVSGAQNYVTLSDVFAPAKHNFGDFAEKFGWGDTDLPIEIDFHSKLLEGDVPCVMMTYPIDPVRI